MKHTFTDDPGRSVVAAQVQVPQPVRRIPDEPDGAAHHHVALRRHGEPRVRDELRGDRRREFNLAFFRSTRAREKHEKAIADISGQEIDFAALFKAYDDELMEWKSNIDERHKGEKKSKGQSTSQPFVLPAAVSAPPESINHCSPRPSSSSRPSPPCVGEPCADRTVILFC